LRYLTIYYVPNFNLSRPTDSETKLRCDRLADRQRDRQTYRHDSDLIWVSFIMLEYGTLKVDKILKTSFKFSAFSIILFISTKNKLCLIKVIWLQKMRLQKKKIYVPQIIHPMFCLKSYIYNIYTFRNYCYKKIIFSLIIQKFQKTKKCCHHQVSAMRGI